MLLYKVSETRGKKGGKAYGRAVNSYWRVGAAQKVKHRLVTRRNGMEKKEQSPIVFIRFFCHFYLQVLSSKQRVKPPSVSAEN